MTYDSGSMTDDAGQPIGPRHAVGVVLTVCLFAGAVCLLAGTAGASDVSIDELNGSGTVDDPYVITNATELQAIQQDLAANYTIADDIDATNTATWNGGNGFEPIGRENDPFTGTLDGRSHQIRGLTINRPDEGYVGLFARVDGTVGNLSLSDVMVIARETGGGIAAENRGTIRQVTVSGDVIGKEDYVGGLVGRNRGTVIGVQSSGSVRGTRFVGGLIGQNGGPVRASATDSDVRGTRTVGGLIGANGDAVTDTYALGRVNGSRAIGGLAGNNHGTLSSSFAAVSMQSANRYGGIAGSNSGIVLKTYWDRQRSGTDNGTAAGANTGTGLRTSQLTGAAASSNTELDFQTTWRTTDRYPELRSGIGNETILPVVEDEPTVTVNRSLLTDDGTDSDGGGGVGLVVMIGGGIGLLGLVGVGGLAAYVYREEYME